MSNQTDNTCLIWKALDALTKYFSCKQNIPNILTVEVFNDHFLSLAKTLTKTLQRGDEKYQCFDVVKNFCRKRLKFDDTFIIPEITRGTPVSSRTGSYALPSVSAAGLSGGGSRLASPLINRFTVLLKGLLQTLCTKLSPITSLLR